MTTAKARLSNIGMATFLHIFDLLRDDEATVEGVVEELHFTYISARVKLNQGKLIFKENMVEEVLNIIIRSRSRRVKKQDREDAVLLLKEWRENNFNKGV